ncbi:hypothetical protein [Clostridium tagluense]|uniref:hypothetical protein n=1 Tax=Clostridium tagluense TaxID=360422 RepID=UPI001C6E397C|nr:hypothetical protein [Clostridium tagluense]MBW9154868.1 hypothetical protein [Clostridium tagluense]WLC64323.1 hypothetical protein KTC93_15795 [Clostridium tagluense]
MGKIIKQWLKILIKFIINNIDDILIFSGCGVFITALFLFVSIFVGMIGLSIVLILIGFILSKLPTNNR